MATLPPINAGALKVTFPEQLAVTVFVPDNFGSGFTVTVIVSVHR
jgi:hypothetical protein